ncbi:MAG: hydrolase, partial [OM182 bacterium]|nr:hydrolase [OM182 bacterium]
MVRGVSALILLGASAYASAADAPPLSSYEIPRINLAPRIDGKVEAAEWREAKRVVIDIETDPAENVRTTVSADAFIMEDGETLYVAFIASDPDVSQIRAFYSDRDLLWDD